MPKAIWYPAETSDERIESPHSDEKNGTIENAKRNLSVAETKKLSEKNGTGLKAVLPAGCVILGKVRASRRRMPDCRVMPLHAFDHGQTVSFAVFPVAGENIRFFEGCRL